MVKVSDGTDAVRAQARAFRSGGLRDGQKRTGTLRNRRAALRRKRVCQKGKDL